MDIVKDSKLGRDFGVLSEISGVVSETETTNFFKNGGKKRLYKPTNSKLKCMHMYDVCIYDEAPYVHSYTMSLRITLEHCKLTL